MCELVNMAVCLSCARVAPRPDFVRDFQGVGIRARVSTRLDRQRMYCEQAWCVVLLPFLIRPPNPPPRRVNECPHLKKHDLNLGVGLPARETNKQLHSKAHTFAHHVKT